MAPDVGSNLIYEDAQLRISRTLVPKGLRLTGEIDAWNVEAFTGVLAASLTEAPDDLHIEASELQFCDLCGIRAMVQAAMSMQAGRRLVLHGLPAQLQRVVQVVGWGELPNLVSEADQTLVLPRSDGREETGSLSV